MKRKRGPDGRWYDVPQYCHVIGKKWRWIPSPEWRESGAVGETLVDAPVFTRANLDRANDLNDLWNGVHLERSGKVTPNKRRALAGSVAWLIREFEQTVEYRLMADRTKEGIDWAFRVLTESPMAQKDVRTIQAHHCKQYYEQCFKAYGHHQALRAITWLRKLLSYARLGKGLIKENPAFALELEHPPPRKVVWSWPELRAMLRAAFRANRWSIAMALSIAYDSSQRLGDVMDVQWSQYDGEGLDWGQEKTGTDGWTPLSRRTIRLLAAVRRRAATAGAELGPWIVVNENTGTRYSSRGPFGRVFRKIKKAAKIERRVTFHDVRRTVGSEIFAGGGRIEPITLHVPGSPAAKPYQIHSKEAAREAQGRRQRITEIPRERRPKREQFSKGRAKKL